MEIREQEENFDKLLEKKNSEISLLIKEIEELRKLQKEVRPSENSDIGTKSKPTPKGSRPQLGTRYDHTDYMLVTENKKIYPMFSNVIKHIGEEKEFPDIAEDLKEFFLVNEFVQEDYDALGDRIYTVTSKGRELYKKFFNEQKPK